MCSRACISVRKQSERVGQCSEVPGEFIQSVSACVIKCYPWVCLSE